jgi:hypothetical protein
MNRSLRSVALGVAVAMSTEFVCLADETTTALAKARDQIVNGLLDAAKGDLMEIAYAASATPAQKAEAWLLLGNVAQVQHNGTLAKYNWTRATATEFEGTESARIAAEKLSLLASGLAESPAPPATPSSFAAGTVLVVAADSKFYWAAVQTAGALRSGATPFEGSLGDALKLRTGAGVVEIAVDPDSAYESAHVTCYKASGEVAWEIKQIWHMSFGADKIARDLVGRVSKKVKGRGCP